MADIKMINNYNIKDETARNEIEAVRAQIPDISNLATKAEIPTVPTNVSELNNDANYLTEHQDISHLATREEIPVVPTNIGDFVNDAGYVSETYVDNAALGLQTQINDKADAVHTHDEYLTEHQDISHLALKSEIPEVPSIEGLATEDYVNDAIGDINAILDAINGRVI